MFINSEVWVGDTTAVKFWPFTQKRVFWTHYERKYKIHIIFGKMTDFESVVGHCKVEQIVPGVVLWRFVDKFCKTKNIQYMFAKAVSPQKECDWFLQVCLEEIKENNMNNLNNKHLFTRATLPSWCRLCIYSWLNTKHTQTLFPWKQIPSAARCCTSSRISGTEKPQISFIKRD